MDKNIELVEYNESKNTNEIVNPKVDGLCKRLLEEHMSEKASKEEIGHIFSNGFKVLPYLVDPHTQEKKTNKILCLGKVQSGKTSFFIATIALAFDNGYNLAYVIGGTKTKLKDQNYIRLSNEYKNNPGIVVIDMNMKDHLDPIKELKNGKKVILVSLKNVVSNTANLWEIEEYSKILSNYPTIIIDDEGDECSPGAPKLKSKNPRAGQTHDVLSLILSNIDVCSFLSVTATPQANFLISTVDNLSPDYAVLVEPGKGYTGGNAFHDVYNNPHVVEITDSSEFLSSIPKSFEDCLFFFIFSVLTQLSRKNRKEYSMLVHPSSLTKVQTMVVEKIRDYYINVKKMLLDRKNIVFDDYYESIFNSGKEAISDFSDYQEFKRKTIDYLEDALENISVFEFNVSGSGRASIKEEQETENRYKIYVGGNMLGRGLTIENLCSTYIYRDSKISQIDTLYQRARWFGYKEEYFDLCRVYMTRELKGKFIEIVDNENDMWNSVNSFLLTKTNMKKFPRLFMLKNEKLRLTRTSVSKTVFVERINPGYSYDKSIWCTLGERAKNKELYYSFLKKYLKQGVDEKFGKSENQHHLIISMKFSVFYNEFLSLYCFPRNGVFGLLSFSKILKQIESGVTEDQVKVVVMRYKSGEYRTPIAANTAIKELPQSYDDGTGYCGDKSLPGLDNVFHIQIHPVYIDKRNSEDVIPLLAMNNPITTFNVRYVTGDNYYGEI